MDGLPCWMNWLRRRSWLTWSGRGSQSEAFLLLGRRLVGGRGLRGGGDRVEVIVKLVRVESGDVGEPLRNGTTVLSRLMNVMPVEPALRIALLVLS